MYNEVIEEIAGDVDEALERLSKLLRETNRVNVLTIKRVNNGFILAWQQESFEGSQIGSPWPTSMPESVN